MKVGKWIVALAILGVSLFFALFSFESCPCATEQEAATMAVHGTLHTALVTFRYQCGRFPTTEEGLRSLVECPPELIGKWKGPYLDGPIPVTDPWKREYLYVSPGLKPGEGYPLWSRGKDIGSEDDDIKSWEKK